MTTTPSSADPLADGLIFPIIARLPFEIWLRLWVQINMAYYLWLYGAENTTQ